MLVARKSITSNFRFYSSVIRSLKSEKIVPDVINVAPPQIIEIVYPNGVEVNLGNILTPTQVKYAPSVKWTAKGHYFYTLCMIDPDAPSRKEPKNREWHHWMIGNIPGDDIDKGETLSTYIGSGPPLGTGLHRYVFLVFKQPTLLKFENVPILDEKSADNRKKFSIRKFAAKYRLGHPVAANFYQAEFDDYVPFLYKQLGAE